MIASLRTEQTFAAVRSIIFAPNMPFTLCYTF